MTTLSLWIIWGKRFLLLLVAVSVVSAQERGVDLFTIPENNSEIKKFFQNPFDAPVFQRFSDEDGLSQINVWCILQDSKGFLWIGTINGLNRYDGNQFVIYRNDFQDQRSLSDNAILSIYETKAGEIWIGTGNGLNRYDPATNSFRIYKFNENNPNGLNTLNRQTETFTRLKHAPNDFRTPSSDAILAIHEDKNGTLWFGTDSGGLNRLDRATGKFTYFTEREGLPNNLVYDIQADDANNLWLSTDKGLARFNPETKAFRNFDTSDGLTHNEFNHRAAFQNRAGEMFFGGRHGFVRFHPKDFTDSDFKPPIYLTNIRIFEQPLKTEQNITELKELNLSWRDYVVSFDFAALDLTNPKKLQYQWKLEGFDNAWINGGTRRTATYTNLPGGDYVLKVKATNNDGVWSEESLRLRVTVTPPFYRTFWFWGLIAIFVGLLIWLFYRNRVKQLRLISETQTKFTQQLIESQEAERKRIAAELHDGLGQSLLVIKNRTIIGKRVADDSVKVTAQLGEIAEVTSHALEEVRSIAYNLRPYHLERLGLRESIEAMIEKVREATGLEINARVSLSDEVFSKSDEVTFYRVIQECLNNIIKHAEATAIEISIVQTETEVTAQIQDNGRGFVMASENQAGGFGLIGLAERIRMLGGMHSISSEAGKGTTVIMKIPRDKE